jgi:hypothetical protein
MKSSSKITNSRSSPSSGIRSGIAKVPAVDDRKAASAQRRVDQNKTKQTLRDLLANVSSSPKQQQSSVATSFSPSTTTMATRVSTSPPKTISPPKSVALSSQSQSSSSSSKLPRTVGTMSSELAVLRREEEAREARLAAIEADTKKVQAAIDAHSARYADLRDEIARVSESYAETEDSLTLQLEALQAERAEAEEHIAFESESEAKKAMDSWAERLQAATEEVERECKLELEDSVAAEKRTVAELNRYAAEARLKAAEVSNEITQLVAQQLEGVVASHVASIDNQRAASLRAVQQHMLAVHRLEAILSAVKEGRDTGEDVSGYLKDSPGTHSSASSPSSSPNSSASRRADNTQQRGGGGGSASSESLISSGDNVLSYLESSDAQTLQLPVQRARQELGDLVDKIVARWTRLRIVSSSSSSLSSSSSPSSPTSSSPSKRSNTLAKPGVSSPFEFLSTSIDVFADGSMPDFPGSPVGVDVADLIRALIDKFKPAITESKVTLLTAQRNEALERLAKLDALGSGKRNAERIQLLRVVSATEAGIREASESVAQ